jgi:hypothetical protein
MNGTRYSEKNLYLTEDLISQSFFYIGLAVVPGVARDILVKDT